MSDARGRRDDRLSHIASFGRAHFRGATTIFCAALAALAYSSWPLGYVLNRSIGAIAYASDLEVRGQPFSWLFITLDVLSGCCVLVVMRLELRDVRARVDHPLYLASLLSYGIFGAATAINALIPLDCGSTHLLSCGADLNHLNADDVVSAVAALSLFVGAVCMIVRSVRLVSWRPSLAVGLLVVVVWALSGLGLLAAGLTLHQAVGLQHVFLSLTSVVVVLVPIALYLVATDESPTEQSIAWLSLAEDRAPNRS